MLLARVEVACLLAPLVPVRQKLTFAWLAGHAELGTGLEAPMHSRADSQSMAAKIASLGRMTPILAMVFNKVKYAPPCNSSLSS